MWFCFLARCLEVFLKLFAAPALVWGVGVSSYRWVLWFCFLVQVPVLWGSCFFSARLCILAQAYMCQGHHFMIGVCFKDVNFSSYPTWLARPHSASFAGFSVYRVFMSDTVQQLQFLDVDG